MLSLIEQLQADTLNRSVPIGDLLRRAKLVAAKLGQAEFAAWVELEMNGYLSDAKLPAYRTLQAELKFLNPVRGWCSIIDSGHTRPCRQPVGEVSALLDGPSDSTFAVDVGSEIIERVSRQIGFDVDVKARVSRASLANIVEAVLNTLLDWALKLDAAGVRGDGISFSKADADLARQVTINIGKIGNAVGVGAFGDNTSISATQSLTIRELAKAAAALATQVQSQVEAFPASIRDSAAHEAQQVREVADTEAPNEGRLRRALGSLQRVMEGAAGNLAAAGVLDAIARLLS